MQPKHITDDLDRLLELLPSAVQKALATTDSREELIEVVLDLGRLPEARYPGRVIEVGNEYISREDLQATVDRLGNFGADNRAGIERTLHRISAIRNRQREVVGLTCRVGRAVFGTVAMVRDLLDSGESLLLMGRPGVGKTTALREIARVLADDLQRRVVVIDTSNEIAGDGDIPHPAIGRARRMQVGRPEHQHQVMIEAVENHMPEVIVIDEIGTELETHAARTIAERGVQLVATAHGNALANLIKNPTLSDLVGGIQSVTLGDEEARRRHTQKTVLERAAEPTFPIAIEINSRSHWSIHTNVATTVDLLLRGTPPRPQERELNIDGSVQLVNSKRSESQKLKAPITPNPLIKNTNLASNELPKSSQASNHQISITQSLKVFCCGITPQLFEEAVRHHGLLAEFVDAIKDAEVVLSIRQEMSKSPEIRKQARELQLPILVIKSNSLHQVERAIERLLARRSEQLSNPFLSKFVERDDALAALEECRLALEKVVVPLGKPVELLPRTERVLQMQSDLVSRYQLSSNVFGHAEQQRLRIFPS